MPSFSIEFDRLWTKQAKELGRDLTKDESRELDGRLFQSWIDSGRLDELIRTILANSGRAGGLEEIVALGYHLRQCKDEARIHTLFRSLISIRVKAFHQWWPRATDGQVSCMREAARSAAEAMDAYIEYFNSLDQLGLIEQKEVLREEMKRFQARETAKKVLHKSAAKG